MDLAGVYAWTPVVEALAAMAPLWPPGSRSVYHPLTYGYLAGEPLRRVAGCSVGNLVARDIASPLGLDFFIGLPEALDSRVAEIVTTPSVEGGHGDLATPYPEAGRNPSVSPAIPNTRAWRAAEIPGANGHATAGALAILFGGLAAGTSPLLTADGLSAMLAQRFRGIDDGEKRPMAYGAGVRLYDPKNFGTRPSPGLFGHPGWGGSLAFGDREARLGFAYTTCKMEEFGEAIDPRRKLLIDAVYDSL
jgi:CubicO group peptidase (beta-lactamase class C family)